VIYKKPEEKKDKAKEDKKMAAEEVEPPTILSKAE